MPSSSFDGFCSTFFPALFSASATLASLPIVLKRKVSHAASNCLAQPTVPIPNQPHRQTSGFPRAVRSVATDRWSSAVRFNPQSWIPHDRSPSMVSLQCKSLSDCESPRPTHHLAQSRPNSFPLAAHTLCQNPSRQSPLLPTQRKSPPRPPAALQNPYKPLTSFPTRLSPTGFIRNADPSRLRASACPHCG